jgi:hypothetical protein
MQTSTLSSTKDHRQSNLSSRVVLRIAANRAFSGAIEEVVDKVVC